MKCDKCKQNEASVYIEQNINGIKHTAHLCNECATNYNMNTAFSDAFQSFVNSFKAFSPEMVGDSKKSDKACPICGLTYSQFKRGQKLGCAKCYETFADELTGIFTNIQPGKAHTGKIPKKFGAEHIQSRELGNLKSSLSSAIKNEEYEEAARLRDLIRGMEEA